MKKLNLFLFIALAFGAFKTNSQTTVTDYDGNVYNTITIGTQTWLKENTKSIHYADGTSIPGVVAYNNDEGLAAIYGRLYTWNAAVHDSIAAQVQGVCPCGWHVASNTEWTELITYLGGSNVAGGKMKEAGTTHWQSPNTGADNSSGFTALGSGEYDAHEFMVFQLIHQYEVYWTSTQVSTTLAKEKYLSYSDAKCLNYDWYKVMKYSVRCVQNTVVNIPEKKKPSIQIINSTGNRLQLLYERSVDIKSMDIYNMQGALIIRQDFENTPTYIDILSLAPGTYLAVFYFEKESITLKFNTSR